MTKVFISHSSSDKEWFVKPLINHLKKYLTEDRIVYDDLTFEAGRKIENEIEYFSENSDLFVFLLSDKALDSEWIKYEMKLAEKLENCYSKEERIFPIIIDSRVKHDDNRIPSWMKEYNIRNISSANKMARMIYSRLIEIVWQNKPRIKAKSALFVGRNEEMEQFEERIYDFNAPKLNFIIASGLSKIGRRSFLQNYMVKTRHLKESYESPKIMMDGHESIEDFILYVSDVIGVSDEEFTSGLLEKSMENKIEIAFSLLEKLKESNDKLFVEDRGALITHQGDVAEWFLNLARKVEDANNKEHMGILCYMASRYKPKLHKYGVNNIFSIQINELSISDRNKLLHSYSQIVELDIDNQNLSQLSSIFSGFPEEILFTVDLMKQEGYDYLMNKDLIKGFTHNRISTIINEFKYSENQNMLLKLISRFGVISLGTLKEILQNIGRTKDWENDLETLILQGMCTKLGVMGEYITLNTAAKKYFERQEKLDKEIESVVNKFLKNFSFESDNYDARDTTFIISEWLKRGELDNLSYDKLIPSYYLKTMKNLYDSKTKDKDVIKLADRILEFSDTMDSYIKEEIRFFLCSSLARLKEKRFLSEVREFQGYKQDFLYGFYYRQTGKHQQAIEYFKKVLEQNNKYAQAKRELVLLYNKVGEYEKAYTLAKGNYEKNRDNPYHIHAYFQAVFYQKSDKLLDSDKPNVLKNLLNDLSGINTDVGKNMYLTSKAKYHMEIEVDYEEVEKIIQQFSDEGKHDNIYVLLLKIDYYSTQCNLDELEKILESMKKYSNKTNNYYNDYLKCRIFVSALKGDEMECQKTVSELTYSEKAKANLVHKMNKLLEQK
ncbi:MAG: TIR domain-containing protein [Aerococcaceae bacterium]|nr:TIR domain-containing protein [Aerococcaceae bacterium]